MYTSALSCCNRCSVQIERDGFTNTVVPASGIWNYWQASSRDSSVIRSSYLVFVSLNDLTTGIMLVGIKLLARAISHQVCQE